MERVRVSVTWWSPSDHPERQVAVETYDENGHRTSCLTFEAALRDADLVRAVDAVAFEVKGKLPF